MRKMRLHLWVGLGLFAVLFIIGSFADLSINQALFSKGNSFGMFIAAFGMIPGYGVMAVLAGLFIRCALLEKKTWIKVLFFAFAAALIGCSVYFAGKEIFGRNGYYHAGTLWLIYGMLIALPFMGGFTYLGFRLGKGIDNPDFGFILIVLSVAMLLALVAGTTLIKIIFHRPRFRIAVYEGIVEFHPWWQRCGNYQALIDAHPDILSSEEFKSFPSGHTSVSALLPVLACFLPLFYKKAEKWAIPCFYAGLVWALLVAFTRMLVGAHFLSDIAMGGFLTFLCFIIANEVILRAKPFKAIAGKETGAE